METPTVPRPAHAHNLDHSNAVALFLICSVTVGAAPGALIGAAITWARAPGRLTKNVGASASVAGTSPPSQKRPFHVRFWDGREGSVLRSSRLSGALSRNDATGLRSHIWASP